MFFASLMVLMGSWAWWCIPETKGKTLEEMEAIFGAPTALGVITRKLDPIDRATDEKDKELDCIHLEDSKKAELDLLRG